MAENALEINHAAKRHMSRPASPGTIVPSIETSSDFDFDLENGEDDLLADALDKVERDCRARDPFENYETHRALEQSLSPNLEGRISSANRSFEAAAVTEISYEDLLEETLTCMCHYLFVLTPLTDI